MCCDPLGTFEDATADLSCVAGQGTFTGSGLSHPAILVMDDAERKNRSLFTEKRMSMAPKIKAPPKLTVLPLLPQENLYVGVDVEVSPGVRLFAYRGVAQRAVLE